MFFQLVSAITEKSQVPVLSPSTWGRGHPDRDNPCEARQKPTANHPNSY